MRSRVRGISIVELEYCIQVPDWSCSPGYLVVELKNEYSSSDMDFGSDG